MADESTSPSDRRPGSAIRPRQLTPEVALFVGGEHSNVYFHVSGLIMLDARGRPDFGFERFRAHVESRFGEIPHFRWRLHEVPLGLDLPYWVEDEEFDFDNHIKRIAVPRPGDREALSDVVSTLYSRHLDRRYPLWETWFIEGLGDEDQYAVFSKIHHCMMDGQGAAKLLEVISDLEPDAEPRPLDAHLANAATGATPERWRQGLTTAKHLYGLPFRAGRAVIQAAQSSVRARSLPGPADRTRAPKSPFNRDITGRRGFVFGSISLTDIKTVKNHFGVTVNDVVLAVVAGSLRDYLLRTGELPDDPLRTSIAVSLRNDGDESLSNKVTTVTVSLATHIDDPLERLRAIADDSDRAKQRARSGGTTDLLGLVSFMPPALVGAMTAIVPTDVVWQVADTNVIVSNVRGSPFPLFMGGARTTAMFPMSIITTGGALNVTCMSFLDQLDVGITIEPRLVPEPWQLIDGLVQQLKLLSDLVPSPKRRRARAK